MLDANGHRGVPRRFAFLQVADDETVTGEIRRTLQTAFKLSIDILEFERYGFFTPALKTLSEHPEFRALHSMMQ
ncbi:hypothetical protein [Leisingera methylohalidivorans]|uniref:Uncharacterized protein n=1 Tax=Leisingera methylohalidivorans DSM 14336 TaxID=999552 RepID=V9VW78_9RHOB|nr:hypothetical protein [Leisingera methylohalidivorans]AHD03016.1 hypothetical protein METH_08690 [Leisingera methylohalidivorans DSM 14336]